MAGYNLIPNMEQMNPEYANSTQYTKTGGKTYAVTYGPNGEYQVRTLVPDYDYNLGVDRAGLGGSVYDQFFMTNTELGQIADARRAAQYGDYSGLAALGIDTSALTGDGYTVTGGSGGTVYKNNDSGDDEEEADGDDGETTGGKLSSGEALLKATGAYEDQESQVMALYMMYVNGQITEKQYKDLADAITTDRQNR